MNGFKLFKESCRYQSYCFIKSVDLLTHPYSNVVVIFIRGTFTEAIFFC